MAASYPAALPTRITAGATLATNPHSTLHNRMWEEIVAIATELGTNVSGSHATLAARLDAAIWPSTSASGAVNQSTSNISKTVNYSKYFTQGTTVVWMFKYTMSGSGSAGTAITLNLPVNAVRAQDLNGWAVYRTGATTYVCAMEGTSTSAVKLHDGASSSSGLGASPSFAVASGHIIHGFIMYPKAA